MFYSQFILAKKGPLGTIWVAAHLERKLRKNQVADTDIGVSVDSILFPEVPIALRLSSHLLLGVVRIYSRKVNYLFDDCSEALLKIKQAFRSTAVDLPPEESTAPYHSITLPETFDLDDFELPDNEIYQGNYVDHHVSSRELITLQDTMEGVVYATSQFGLDERFGDGDTSQIGLDLDEELFMDKVKSQVGEEFSNLNPQKSNHTINLLEFEDGSDEKMLETSQAMVMDFVYQTEVPSANTEFVEYAQAPSTPGLLQEPNLSSVQKALACEDHLEAEDHILTDFVVEDGKVSEPSKNDLYGEGDNGSNRSLSNDFDKCMSVEENEHLSIGLENNQVKSEVFPSTTSAEEHVLEDEINVLGGQAMKEKEDTCNGDVLSKSMHFVDQANVDCAIKDGLDGSLTSGFCQGANDVEIGSGCISGDFVVVAEGCLVDGQASPKISNVLDEVVSPGKMSDADLPYETPMVCEVSNSQVHNETSVCVLHKEMSGEKPVLQACNIILNQHDKLSGGGDDCHATDHMKVGLKKTELLEAALCGEADYKTSDEHIDDATSSDIHSLNVKSSTAPVLSAPERLLSLPNALSSHNNLLMDFSTPDKDILLGNNYDRDAIQPISGKKRNFAESTLMEHSLNSIESVGVARSKRTREYVPDDDDLLSSILVGRSSVLKMKPTPVAEVTSMKRPRSVVRASTMKRKVLMDDTMVVHGDMIRQQLTSTEDIRRLRKKAPCTRPEISMLERQFLEDEIFCETILSGMSGQLIALQHETLDFSGVRVSHDCQEKASLEVTKYSEPVVTSNIIDESRIEENIELTKIRNCIEAPPVDISNQTESEHVEESNLESQDFQSLGQETAIADVSEPQTLPAELQGEITKMEIEGGNFELANLTTESTIGVPGFTSPGVRKNSFDSGGPLLMDTSCFSSETRFDFEHVINDSTRDISHEERPVADNLHHNDEDRDLFTECLEPTVPYETVNPEDDGSNCGSRVIREGEVRCEDTGIDENDPISSCLTDEAAKIVSSSTVGYDIDVKSASFSGAGCLESDAPNIVEAVNSTVNHSTGEDYGNFEDLRAGNDTEFLNVDDDEIAGNEEDDQFTEETRFIENSGWSSRTRAVAKYLQAQFDNEAIQGKKVILIDNLLVKKSRKEASRMFFETLVLKTRDYVHVEQAMPFDNISIKPRVKLMKSDF